MNVESLRLLETQHSADPILGSALAKIQNVTGGGGSVYLQSKDATAVAPNLRFNSSNSTRFASSSVLG